MSDNTHPNDGKLPKALYGCARFVVLIFAAGVGAIGVWGLVAVGGGWWASFFWILMLIFGVVLVFIALFGQRDSVDDIVTHFLSAILDRLF